MRISGIGIVCCFYFLFSPVIKCSRITMSDGMYNNILLAIHPDIPSTQCLQLIQNITDAFRYTSSQLSLATNGTASFGSLTILIPSTWGLWECADLQSVNVSSAALHQLYQNADFKVSANPHTFANGKLPWTNQFKGCENESDSIYVPLDFFQSGNFDAETKGKILLAEWSKFRYGVFEEHAYFADLRLPSCYSYQGNIFYAGCSNIQLNESLRLSGRDSTSTKVCEHVLQKILERSSRTEDAAFLLGPQLPNTRELCNTEFQIGISSTKHNLICERRSIAEVVLSHPDFHTSHDAELFPNTRKQRPGSSGSSSALSISIVRRDENYSQGYAIILEDDVNLRKFGRIQHIKQGIAQILQLMKPMTNVAVLRYEGPHYTHSVMRVTTELDKLQILSKIPEPETPSLSEYISGRGWARSSKLYFPDAPSRKKTSFLKTLQVLNDHQSDQWHLILITSAQPGDLVEALPQLGNSPHTISVLTFDDSKEWLEFNKIPNSNKVLFLPSCPQEPINCAGNPTSLFLTYFTEILATSNSILLFTHTAVDFSFVGEEEATFTIPRENFVSDLENFQLFLPVHTADSVAILYSPKGKFCRNWKLLNYNYVIQFDTSISTGCPYEVGKWAIKVVDTGTTRSRIHSLTGIGETGPNSESNLLSRVSYGKSLLSEIFPTLMSLPVYVQLLTKIEQPVINAQVSLQIIHSDQNSSNSKSIYLEDNGVDPDLIANDGIYSAYVTDFSSRPGFHTGHVTVKTVKGKAKSIVALDLVNGDDGVLFDERLSVRCCSSFIPAEIFADVGTGIYTVYLSSFRTGEVLDPTADISPPSRIHSHVKVLNSISEDHVTIEFIAPGADYSSGTVASYDICCTNSSIRHLDDSMCTDLLKSEDIAIACKPVPGNTVQRCTLLKSFLAIEFFNGTFPISPITLYCGIRGVDSARNLGALSYDVIEINMRQTENDPLKAECTGISDGCLRIDVFWALVGCIAGLILILIMVVLCWCCLTRRDQKLRKKKRKFANESNWVDAFPRDSLNNVYINQAYIQDAHGQLKVVARDGALNPSENSTKTTNRTLKMNAMEGTKNISEREIPSNDADTELEQQQVSWTRNAEDIAISSSTLNTFLTEQPLSLKTFPPAPPSSTERLISARFRRNPQTLSSVGNRNSERNIEFENLEETENVPATSGVVYASVFRTRRKLNTPKMEDGTLQQHLKINNENVYHDLPLKHKQDTREVNSVSTFSTVDSSGINQKTNQVSIRPLPPVRLDHFPSSESEIYSDLSLIIKSPVETRGITRDNINKRSQVSDWNPRPMSSPGGIPSGPENHNAVQVTIPTHHRSMEIQRPNKLGICHAAPPPTPPPPPPPRTPNRYDYVSPNHFALPEPLQTGEVNYDEDQDYDSDAWEDYDDAKLRIQNKPGASYA